MIILFFDTETTGLLTNEPISKQPHACQLAWMKEDTHSRNVESHNFIIKPEGWVIPYQAERVHGISTVRASEEGKPAKEVYTKFLADIQDVDLFVAHNITYDYKIIAYDIIHLFGTEYWDSHNRLKPDNMLDTMKESTEYCAIPHYNGYKWPRLEELYYTCFNETFPAHDAMEDVKALRKCFWALNNVIWTCN